MNASPVNAESRDPASADASALAAAVGRITSESGMYSVPGLAVVVERADGTRLASHGGIDARGTPVVPDTLFPLASTTKLATGLLVLRLVERGAFALDDRLDRFVPEAAAAHPEVTVRRLLSHTSGLPFDLAPATGYGQGLDRAGVERASIATPLQFAPGSIVQYSNVGYGLLATMVSRVAGRPFWTALVEEVIRPLGIDAHPSHELPRSVAALDGLRSSFVNTAFEPINSPYWHDLAVPWAGLYGTPDALLGLARAYEDGSPLVSSALLAEARRDQTGGMAGGFNDTDPLLGFSYSGKLVWPRAAWGLGVELHGGKVPHWAPPRASAGSFGHAGAFGCFVWSDPAGGARWAVLGTRANIDVGWPLRHGRNLGNVALGITTAPRP